MRTAIVHHWLVASRGGERVLEAILDILPSADIFTLVCDQSKLPTTLRQRRILTSFLQRLPNVVAWYPYYLPVFPLATTRLNVTGYDLVISSDAAIVKGVRCDPHATHICYCHTPMRCIWTGFETYYRAAGVVERRLLSMVRQRLREWDYHAAQRVTHFVANSRTVQDRIRDCYGRESVVIYPPVDTEKFSIDSVDEADNSFFLVVSQLVSYKRVDVVVDAFNQSGKPLVVIGDGPDRGKLKKRARPNVRLLGSQPEWIVRQAMQKCKAFVFAGEEDFGIVMAEAQACGKCVVAFGQGGATEIVTHGLTGILFAEQSADALLSALDQFDRTSFNPQVIRASALRFRKSRFESEFLDFLSKVTGSPAPVRSHA
jgi:glycosyltransferase involved in cell wall biosynthesis